MISTILGGLALLAAVTCLTLFFQEKKRNEKRRAAMIKLIQEECGDVASNSYERYQELQKKMQQLAGDITAHRMEMNKTKAKINDLGTMIEALEGATEKRLRDLEAGVIPDYAAARQAAEAVDSFNQGLSNILGFDPMAEARKARESTGGDG